MAYTTALAAEVGTLDERDIGNALTIFTVVDVGRRQEDFSAQIHEPTRILRIVNFEYGKPAQSVLLLRGEFGVVRKSANKL